MPTDTSERGIERLICTASTARHARQAQDRPRRCTSVPRPMASVDLRRVRKLRRDTRDRPALAFGSRRSGGLPRRVGGTVRRGKLLGAARRISKRGRRRARTDQARAATAATCLPRRLAGQYEGEGALRGNDSASIASFATARRDESALDLGLLSMAMVATFE